MDSPKTKQPKSKGRKAASFIVTGVCILFFVFAATLFVLSLVAKKNDSRSVEIFGYSFSVVETDSMTGEIEAGELITVKICKIEEAKVGANAVFIAESGQVKGRQVVHKVIGTGSDEKGSYIITRGVKEGAPTDRPVYAESFVGIAVRHSAFWGSVAKFFSTPVNWILILAIIIGIPVIYTLIKLIVKYGGEVKKERAKGDGAEEEGKRKNIKDAPDDDKKDVK